MSCSKPAPKKHDQECLGPTSHPAESNLGSKDVYGMVEEFLELSRRLSVQTIRGFVAAVHRRIPDLFLELLSCTAVAASVRTNIMVDFTANPT